LMRKAAAGYVGGARPLFIHTSRAALSHRLMQSVGEQLEYLLLVDAGPQRPSGGSAHVIDAAGNSVVVDDLVGLSPAKRHRC
jgi:hypothetical protein